jgi:GxxExxY protein
LLTLEKANFFLFLSFNLFVMDINKLTGLVVDLCIKIHNKVGPGCFERVYEEILYYELAKKGLQVQRQLLLPIRYESLCIENAYKLDLLIENSLVVELKSVNPLPAVYFNQLRTQLSLLELKHGMLINFKVELMKEGIHRVFNNFGKEKAELITKSSAL